MHEHNIVANEEEVRQSRKIIEEIMKENQFLLSDKELELLTHDIVITISSFGGDFSPETVTEIAFQYIKNNFYSRFKEVHRDELGFTFK